MIDYKSIFSKLEDSLKSNYEKVTQKSFEKEYQWARNLVFDEKTDDWYFDTLKFIAFYSGFKAGTVTNKTDVINKHFSDFRTVANYGNEDIDRIMSDLEMIRHKRKIEGVIENAKAIVEIIEDEDYGSVQKYIESFKPNKSKARLKDFYNILRSKFAYLGDVTAFHFMMEIGLDVVKPDRVLVRIFKRLRLIDDEKQYFELIEHARNFSKATGEKIRYIDLVFVVYGQETEYAICLEDNPKCGLCQLHEYCKLYQSKIKEL